MPETRYVEADDGTELAYKVVGDGPVGLLWSFSHLSDVDAIWEYRPISSFLQELARSHRLLVHDRRGMGRSSGERGDLEIDVAGLVWHGPFARSAWAPDYPWGATTEALEEYTNKLAQSWGTEPFAAAFVAGGAPSMAADAESISFFAHWMRQTGDASTAATYNDAWDAVDMRPWLGDVRAPTLLTTRGDDPDEAAHVASVIPGATLVTLDGEDFMPFYNSAPVLAAIHDFIDQTERQGHRPKPVCP